jgi:hypothetical protein
VATTSPSQRWAADRSWVENLTSGSPNIASATNRAADRSRDLGGQIRRDVPRRQPVRGVALGEPCDQGDGGVEVGAGDGTEQQYEHAQAEDGGQGVGRQLHTDVACQLGGLDSGADHDRHQQPGADRLRGRPASEGGLHAVAPAGCPVVRNAASRSRTPGSTQ